MTGNQTMNGMAGCGSLGMVTQPSNVNYYPYQYPYSYNYYTTYNIERFKIMIVGHDLVKVDTSTGETWQKDWYDKSWKRINEGTN